MFKNISYFEFIDATNKYVSMFPSTKTTFSSPLPKKFDKVFNLDTEDKEQLPLLIQAMKKYNFGFSDFFWFLPLNKTTYSNEEIIEFMGSLYYEPLETTPNYGVVKIKSLNFEKIAYIKDTTLPQEAIDTIPLFITKPTQKFTALGYKKKSSEVCVGDISILSVSLYGYVIYGEHLEASEKASMEEIEKKSNGCLPFRINDKQISPALRCLFEEGGFSLSPENCTCYYLGKDSREGRDPRYWKFDSFGYNRPSSAHMVCVIIKGTPPKELNEPQDTNECSKGVIVTLENALEEFKENGKYTPAFSSHINQLSLVEHYTLFL